jgi:hypothetical protein
MSIPHRALFTSPVWRCLECGGNERKHGKCVVCGWTDPEYRKRKLEATLKWWKRKAELGARHRIKNLLAFWTDTQYHAACYDQCRFICHRELHGGVSLSV